MAVVVVYLLNTTATSPNWFGRVQDNGSAPAGALSAFGWTVAKVATTTEFWRGYIGATARSAAAVTNSYIDAATSPAQGTGSGATTAGDSFRSDAPLNGTFDAGNWTFSFGMRTGAATHSGRMRCNVWASANANGTSARELNSSTLVGSIVTMNASGTTFTSSITWNAPQIVLNNEYVFLQVEWEVTTAGTSNSCTSQFYQASFTTTNYTYAIFGLVGVVPASPGIGSPVFTQNQTLIDTDLVVSSPVLDAPTLIRQFGLPSGGLVVSSPVFDNPAFIGIVNLLADSVAIQSPEFGTSPVSATSSFIANSINIQSPVLDTFSLTEVPSGALTFAANNLNTSQPILQVIPNFTQVVISQHTLTALSLVVSSPVIDAPVFNSILNLLSTSLITSSPVLGPATLAQKQILAPVNLTVVSPTLGAPTVVQAHTFIAALIVASPVLGPAPFIQKHAFLASIATASPVLGTSTLVGTSLLAASSLVVTSPVFGKPSMTGEVALTAITPAISSPVFGAPSLPLISNFTAVNLVAGSLAAGIPLFVGKSLLSASSLAASSLALGAPSLTQTHGFFASTALAVASPVLGIPTFNQNQITQAVAVVVTSPAFGIPSFTQKQVTQAVAIAVASPVFGTPSVNQVHTLGTTSFAVSSPNFSAAVISTEGALGVLPIIVGSLVLGQPLLSQKYTFSAISLAATSPVLGPAVFSEKNSFQAVSIQTVSPVIATSIIKQAHSFNATLTVSPPSISIPLIGIKSNLIAIGTTAASPSLGAPLIVGTSYLATAGVTTASLAFGKPPIALTAHLATETEIVVAPPSIGIPPISLKSHLTGTGIITASPEFYPLNINQRHGFQAIGLHTASPIIRTTLLEIAPDSLFTAGIITTSPSLGAPLIVPYMFTDGIAVSSPVIESGTFEQSHRFIAQTLAASPLEMDSPRLRFVALFGTDVVSISEIVADERYIARPKVFPQSYATLVADAVRVQYGQISLFSESDLWANATSTRAGLSALDSRSYVFVRDYYRIRAVEVDLASTSILSVPATARLAGKSRLFATTIMTSAGLGMFKLGANPNSISEVSTLPTALYQGQPSIHSQSNVGVTNYLKVAHSIAGMQSTSSVTALQRLIRRGVSTIASSTVVQVVALTSFQGKTIVHSISKLDISSAKLTQVQSAVASSSLVSAAGVRTFASASAMLGLTLVRAFGRAKLGGIVSPIASNSTIVLNAIRVKPASTQLISSTSNVAGVVFKYTASCKSSIVTTSVLATVATRFARASVPITVNSFVRVRPTRVYRETSHINASSSVTYAKGRLLPLSDSSHMLVGV